MSPKSIVSNSLPPERILIIGAGPCGLVTLRNLVERGEYPHVELYERRKDIGGVWYFEDATEDGQPPRWPSPAYKGLVGNVLPEFLSFSGFPFPEPPTTPIQPFPTLVETHEYLRAFAEPYLKDKRIKLEREVVLVTELEDGKGWSVLSRDWTVGGKELEEKWDAVVVAVGWYDHPVWPQTEGQDELRKRGLAKHAKWWRGPQEYKGKKALVIANANSSNDIAAQLASISDGPIYQSIRRTAFPGFPSLPNERVKMVAPVSKYILKGDKFDALLTDGTTLHDLDTVQVGTGYRPFPDFVHVLDKTQQHVPILSEETIPNRVPSLHRLIMYAFNPSLAFVGAPMAYTPFIIADVVSTWLALAWTGEIPCPDTPEDKLIFEKERLAAIEKARSEIENPSALMVYNVLGYFEQEYASGLKLEITRARPELENVLPVWSDDRTKLREAMYKTRIKALEYARDHYIAHDP